MAIPDAVRTTVLRRMQRLDDTERAVLARAAVIGRRFDLRVLVATGASSSERVVAALERALALQLVEPDGSTPGRYAFRHALTRDIVYEEFLSGRVRPLHRRIAAELERMLREGDVALLGDTTNWPATARWRSTRRTTRAPTTPERSASSTSRRPITCG